MAEVPVGVNNELSIANEQMRNVKTLFSNLEHENSLVTCFSPVINIYKKRSLKTKHETDTI